MLPTNLCSLFGSLTFLHLPLASVPCSHQLVQEPSYPPAPTHSLASPRTVWPFHCGKSLVLAAHAVQSLSFVAPSCFVEFHRGNHFYSHASSWRHLLGEYTCCFSAFLIGFWAIASEIQRESGQGRFLVGAFGIATPPTAGRLHLDHIWSDLVLFMLGDSFQPHRSWISPVILEFFLQLFALNLVAYTCRGILPSLVGFWLPVAKFLLIFSFPAIGQVADLWISHILLLIWHHKSGSLLEGTAKFGWIFPSWCWVIITFRVQPIRKWHVAMDKAKKFGDFAILCFGRLALAHWSKKFSIWATLKEGISKNSEYSLSLMPEVMHLWSSAWSTWMHRHCYKSGADLLYAWIVHICGSQNLTFNLKNWSFWCTSAQ